MKIFEQKVITKLGQPVKEDEIAKEEMDKQTLEVKALGVSAFAQTTPKYEAYEDDSGGSQERILEADSVNPETYDGYISAEVVMPNRDGEQLGKVVRRICDEDRVPIDRAHANPILDTHL